MVVRILSILHGLMNLERKAFLFDNFSFSIFYKKVLDLRLPDLFFDPMDLMTFY
jgi:hypothetical protein